MDRMWLFATLALCVCGFGFAMGWITAPDEVPSAAHVPPPGQRTVAGHRPTPKGTDRDVAAMRAHIEQLQGDTDAYLASRRAYEVELYGKPLQWPDDIESRFEPQNFESNVRDLLRDCDIGMELTGFDCSEPPCYALMIGEDDSRSIADCPRWLEIYGGTVSASSLAVACPDGSTMRGSMVAPDMPSLWDGEDEAQGFESNSWKRFSKRTTDARLRIVCPPDKAGKEGL